jgi:hypothetical protein
MNERTPSGGLNTIDDLLAANPDSVLADQRDVFRIVEEIRRIDPNLDVAYLDPDRVGESLFDAPYAVYERCRDGVPRLLFSVWKLDDSVIDRVRQADTLAFDINGAVERANQRTREEIQKRGKERMAEGGDIVKHVLANPKTTYSFPSSTGEVVTLQDDYGIIKREGG